MPVSKETFQGGIAETKASFLPETLNEEKRTIDVCWSTGAKVRRYSWSNGSFNESLSMESEHVDLKRLNAGAPVLNTHGSWDLSDQIGVVERAWLEQKKGYARLRLSSRKEIDSIFHDIKDGIIRNISVGYRVHKYKELKRSEDDTKNFLATRWEPMEISFVPVPADAGAQVRSESEQYPIEIERLEMPKKVDPDKNAPLDGARNTPAEPENTPPKDKRGESEVEPPSGTNEAQIRSEARKLASGINSLCNKHSVSDELRTELVENARSLEEAGARILEHIAERSEKQRVKNPHNISIGREEVDVRREAIPNAILHRHDPGSVELSEAGREYRGMSLIDIARVYANVPHGRFMDKREIVSRAFSTSDFPELLGETSKRKILTSYENLIKNQSFQKLVTVRSLPDFKETKDLRLSDTPQLVELPEGSEYKMGYQDLTKEAWHLVTYGRKMGISRQAIICDDLRAFDQLGNWGLAAARLEMFLFWEVFNNNQPMGDGVDLFHKDHKNLEENKDLMGPPSIEAISSARIKMRRQKTLEAEKDKDRVSRVKAGRNLGTVPKHIIVPPELEEDALKIIMPGLYATQNKDKNPYQGYFDIIVGDELADTNAWYMACDKSQGLDLIHMGYLDGIRQLYVEYKTDFDTDQVAVKARMDIACKAKDWKGFYKNPGKKVA